LVLYLQKAFGYSLTSVTTEKAVFLLHGLGDAHLEESGRLGGVGLRPTGCGEN
jgi:hypothetical protein